MSACYMVKIGRHGPTLGERGLDFGQGLGACLFFSIFYMLFKNV